MKLKSILPLIILVLSVFLYSCESNDAPVAYSNISGSTNKVLVELFTNTSCIPCVAANQYLDAVTNPNVIIIRWHTTLYPNDPFYEYNTLDNGTRQTYYNAANANPKGFLLGTFMGNFSGGGNTWTEALNAQLNASRSMGVSLTKTYDTTARTGNLNITINQNSGDAVSDLVYHVALTEDGIAYTANNGERNFDQVLRDLLTSPNGDAINITAGQTVNLAPMSFSIPASIDDKHASLIVFTQSAGSKRIYGVDIVKLR
ncbi:MAG: Omp28-related outer membrane protein [Ignavibacteria bacterium]|nr:Omp28-related outer membrane protein [Ignavibacteria bacterium]